MDCEVQSYFADHVDVHSSGLSTAVLLGGGHSPAVLMNDRDSDEPQLLVCEEEMAESVQSWKDSGSDAEGGGGEGGQLGGKDTEWDEWGSLGVPMPPGEGEPDIAPTPTPAPAPRLLNQQPL